MGDILRCTRLNWGLNRARLITLYKAVIEPALLYGCPVWAVALRRKKTLNDLRGAQRKMTRCITRTFRISSTKSLLAISGLPPIDLRIKEITFSRFLSKSRDAEVFSPRSMDLIAPILRDKHINNTLSNGFETLRPAGSSQPNPPWSYRQLPFKLLLTDDADVGPLPTGQDTIRLYIHSGSYFRNKKCYDLLLCNRV
jgi:hypothetical protein